MTERSEISVGNKTLCLIITNLLLGSVCQSSGVKECPLALDLGKTEAI
jgi:hypothetical protein